jgi:hypothetical protein
VQPTSQPASHPSLQPQSHPSKSPSSQPSAHPSSQPSSQPISKPSKQPSSKPTDQPSKQPSNQPSSTPTQYPTSNIRTPYTFLAVSTLVDATASYLTIPAQQAFLMSLTSCVNGVRERSFKIVSVEGRNSKRSLRIIQKYNSWYTNSFVKLNNENKIMIPHNFENRVFFHRKLFAPTYFILIIKWNITVILQELGFKAFDECFDTMTSQITESMNNGVFLSYLTSSDPTFTYCSVTTEFFNPFDPTSSPTQPPHINPIIGFLQARTILMGICFGFFIIIVVFLIFVYRKMKEKEVIRSEKLKKYHKISRTLESNNISNSNVYNDSYENDNEDEERKEFNIEISSEKLNDESYFDIYTKPNTVTKQETEIYSPDKNEHTTATNIATEDLLVKKEELKEKVVNSVLLNTTLRKKLSKKARDVNPKVLEYISNNEISMTDERMKLFERFEQQVDVENKILLNKLQMYEEYVANKSKIILSNVTDKHEVKQNNEVNNMAIHQPAQSFDSTIAITDTQNKKSTSKKKIHFASMIPLNIRRKSSIMCTAIDKKKSTDDGVAIDYLNIYKNNLFSLKTDDIDKHNDDNAFDFFSQKNSLQVRKELKKKELQTMLVRNNNNDKNNNIGSNTVDIYINNNNNKESNRAIKTIHSTITNMNLDTLKSRIIFYYTRGTQLRQKLKQKPVKMNPTIVKLMQEMDDGQQNVINDKNNEIHSKNLIKLQEYVVLLDNENDLLQEKVDGNSSKSIVVSNIVEYDKIIN